jgi:hypothetical protein
LENSQPVEEVKKEEEKNKKWFHFFLI